MSNPIFAFSLATLVECTNLWISVMQHINFCNIAYSSVNCINYTVYETRNIEWIRIWKFRGMRYLVIYILYWMHQSKSWNVSLTCKQTSSHWRIYSLCGARYTCTVVPCHKTISLMLLHSTKRVGNLNYLYVDMAWFIVIKLSPSIQH